MVTVIALCIGLIWGVIYLIARTIISKEEAGTISIIIIDIIVFVFCIASAGGAGAMFGIIICLVLDILFADALFKTSTLQNIRKTNQQTKKEDKEHNDWGYIEWEEKDR